MDGEQDGERREAEQLLTAVEQSLARLQRQLASLDDPVLTLTTATDAIVLLTEQREALSRARLRAVGHVLEGRSLGQVAELLGVSRSLVASWRRQLQGLDPRYRTEDVKPNPALTHKDRRRRTGPT